MKRTLIILIVGLTSIFALGACGGANDAVSDGAKGALESATGCKVDGDGEKANVECEDGKGSFSVGTGAELPDGFPKDDVPLPDGKIVSGVSTEISGKTAYSVTVQVDSTSAGDDYQSKLVDDGFTIDEEGSFNLGDGGLVAFQAESADWDVNVVGAAGTEKDSNGLVVTVTEHDASTDTTS